MLGDEGFQVVDAMVQEERPPEDLLAMTRRSAEQLTAALPALLDYCLRAPA